MLPYSQPIYFWLRFDKIYSTPIIPQIHHFVKIILANNKEKRAGISLLFLIDI